MTESGKNASKAAAFSSKPQAPFFETPSEPTGEEFRKLRELIIQICGITLGEDKRYLISQRVWPLLRESSSKSYSELIAKLDYSPFGSLLREKLVDAITTNETSFFRDGHPFEAFRDNLFPAIIERIRAARKTPGGARRAKIWCAASSTGQEPYSFAMIVNETLSSGAYQDFRLQDVHMIATDISTEILARAEKGVFSQIEIERGLTDAMRRKYFAKTGEVWSIAPFLRKMIEFRQLNLTRPFGSLGLFDMIACRNVLIYFDEPTKARILEQFYDMLFPGGALLLGSMENTYCLCAKFHSKRIGKTTVYERL